ncbi:hypothetical protein SAMN05444680_10792 [Variovorax sp. YR216]|nr:hypothetical protein SAMN05444680_10792 [Variovorax sp. YR216]
MTRSGLFAIVRIAILCFGPFGTHTQDPLAAVPDVELAGAVHQSFVQRRLMELASARFLDNADTASPQNSRVRRTSTEYLKSKTNCPQTSLCTVADSVYLSSRR